MEAAAGAAGGQERGLVLEGRGREHHAGHRGIVSRDALLSRRYGTARDAASYESGPEDGIPVVLLHGNLSTGRFYEHLFADAPARYRLIAPDMRGFGDTERVPIDATRGLRDWADDTHALLAALGIYAAAAPRRLEHGRRGDRALRAGPPGRLADVHRPVSPYGFGGVKLDGTPHFDDYAGSGGGTGNPEFTARLAAGDRLRRTATPRRAT